ncbi:MAG: copper homeostasis protein CutC [Bacteroidetes bacterium]|nr:copper homeostasis protein CutC [Bacteroidota bacterium]
MLLEVCANSVESAIAAGKGGAQRVELCDNIYEGGTTPSYGTIALARKHLSIDLHVIIRPRGGDFLYSSNELEIMKQDIIAAKNLGADAVVFGMLTPEGKIDKAACRYLLQAAYPMRCTFHRAFDMVSDPFTALEDIIDLGFDTLLTSGLQPKAFEGIPMLKKLVEQAADRISIMPGSGITEENIRDIAIQTKAKAFHVSLRKKQESNMLFRNSDIRMGGIAGISEYEKSITDEMRVKAVVEMLKDIK